MANAAESDLWRVKRRRSWPLPERRMASKQAASVSARGYRGPRLAHPLVSACTGARPSLLWRSVKGGSGVPCQIWRLSSVCDGLECVVMYPWS